MGERVNIQYSVDIDDLGDEVARLIGEAYSSLHTVTLEKVPDKDNVLSLQTIQMIEEIREQLGEIDIRLGDAVNLINGYVSYKSQAIERKQVGDRAESEHASEVPPSPIDSVGIPEVLSNLQEKIAEFQNENPHQG